MGVRRSVAKRKAIGTMATKPAGRPAGKAKVGSKGRAKLARKGAKSGGRQPALPKVEPPVLHIRQLDPIRVCGDRTSVVQLFRVDEQAVAVGKAAGSRQVHLVFNDRHGWYCEHGRSCHAVSAVMRHAGIR